MMEDDFYAVIKLISGEEILSTVCPSSEDDELFLILHNPVVIEVIVMKQIGVQGYKVDPWLKFSDDDTFLLHMDRVITISEIRDPEIIEMYKKFLNQKSEKNFKNSEENDHNFQSVSEARKMFEKLYKEDIKDS